MIDINIGQFLFLNKYNSGVCNIKSVPHSYIFQMYIDSETRQFKTLPILASDFSSWFAAYLQNWQNLTLLYLFCFFTFIPYLEISKRWLFCSQNVNEREGWLQARAYAADRGRWQNILETMVLETLIADIYISISMGTFEHRKYKSRSENGNK